MQTLVFHRFRGALVGAALGELLGGELKPSMPPDLSLFCREPEETEGCSDRDMPLDGWGHRVYTATQQLIEREWSGPSVPDPALPMDAAAHLVAVVPLALYYHQDRALLHHALEQYRQRQNLGLFSPALIDASTLLATAIALGCRPSQRAKTELTDLLQALPLPADSPLRMALQDLNRLLRTGQGMGAVESWMKHHGAAIRAVDSRFQSADLLLWLGVAIALYSVLSTPHFPQLALLRLRQLSFVSPLLGLLTGTLAGVYNGINQFPLDWRLQLQVSPPLHHRIQQRWGVSVHDLVQLSDRLLALWMGADPTADALVDLPLVVSSPVSAQSQAMPS